ncbi:flagellar filament capping protein FliD [Paractinoplanes globisporus]|uniref:Flagellar hook-associated protein 2 n=1 Tax=Paractinoplanes globisporus TaxID=113565 RepID=A0ABW6WSU2_9ACTN|nr:flagellar filament capping protein FliD [Actinoplanes globisporus]
MTSSVDGLVSGLSTSSLIQQLMTVEAAPQDRLKTKVSTAQTAVTSYQSVNSKISTFKSAGDALSQLSSWRAIKATSSSTSVSATTSTNINAATGSLSFNVTSLASKQVTTLPVTTFYAKDADGKLDDPVQLNVPDTITVTTGSYDADGVFTAGSGQPVSVDIHADKSAAGIAKALNAANAGVTAYVMKTGDTAGVLQMTSAKSGASNGFQIDGLDGAGSGGEVPLTTYASDAQLTVNGGGGSTYTVNSSTNTFTNLMAGVTLTVSQKENNVTVDVSNDTGAIADKFQAMVDAANAALTEIGTQTKYDAATKTGSPLTGDFAVRNMSQQILGSVSLGVDWSAEKKAGTDISGKINTLKELGIQLDSTGQLSFDRAAFLNTYSEDPARAQEAGIRFGDTIEKMGGTMSTNLTSVITGRNNEISSLNDQISNWDVRLAAKREALQKQYSDLEVALGKLKDQSSWLSGQLAGLS